MCLRTDFGQATVEASFMIPILFVSMLVLLQPGIILYDRMVMNHAAAEACRMLATSTGSVDSSEKRCEELIRRRLGAIPQQELFHVHDGGCSYRISLSGNDSSSTVQVRISNRLKPLPLNILSPALKLDSEGCFEVSVVQEAGTRPAWLAGSSSGSAPESWVYGRE